VITDPSEAGEAELVVSEDVTGLKVAVRPATGTKCERCWILSPTVGEDTEHPTLCSRCAGVVRSLTD
jgi:isoleucyl-tRNA synthetase